MSQNLREPEPARFKDQALVCVIHSADLSTGAPLGCVEHLRLLGPFFRESHVIVPESGPLVPACEALGVRVWVFPILNTGLRAAGLRRAGWKDLGRVLGSRVRHVWRTWRLLRSLDGIVHAHTTCVPYTLIGAWLARRPVVTHLRESRRPGWEEWLRETVTRIASDRIASVSRGVMRAYGRGLTRKARVIYDFHSVPGESPRGSDAHREGPACIGMVGFVSPRKGYREFLETCRALKQSGVVFRARIVGRMCSREVEAECRDFIARHGLSPEVEIAGYAKDLEAEYRRLDVLLHPAHWDPLPHVVMEAMARGIPCVASNVDGIPEMIVHGETGFVADRGDIGALAEYTGRLLRDPGLRARMGEAGRRRVEAAFNPDGYRREMLALYAELIRPG
jgi:glycosyltransferase involved in cell wall biosynthesis